MIARKNRRHRDPSPMFPFGDIMLPVIGIVALGLLVVGIKMFFLPANSENDYTPVPLPQVIEKQEKKQLPTKPVVVSTVAEGKVESSKNEKKTELIAVPVGSAGQTQKPSMSVLPKQNPNIDKVEASANTETDHKVIKTSNDQVKGSSSVSDVSKFSWNVQIGSFVERKSAQSEAQRAENAGFKASIITASVNGKSYHRVFVPAGKERSDAVILEKKLKQKGFPTFITQYANQ